MTTLIKGDPKAPFLIATTPRYWGRCYSFPGLLHFTLNAYLIMLSVKQGGIKYHFLSLWYDSTWDWTPVSQTIGEHSIYLLLPPTRHNLTHGQKPEGRLKCGYKPCWSMLLISSLGVMWAWWGKQFHKPKCGSGHICRVMAWTRQQGLVPYIGFKKVHGDLSHWRTLYSFG